MEIGVRELKARLSEFLDRVEAGESVVVTERGRPVARLVPYSGGSSVERGIEEGWIEPARRAGLGSFARQHSPASVLDVLDEDRG